MFDQALFFAASPEQLGLVEEHGFLKSKPYVPAKTTDLGFPDNEALKKFLVNNLQNSQKVFDEKLAAGEVQIRPDSDCGYPKPACQEKRPEIICQAHGQLIEIGDFAYDRRAPTCCQPWKWSSGQTFTVVGFNRHMGYPVGMHNPNLKDLPETLPGHVGWWLSFDRLETPEAYSWGYSLYNHYSDGGMTSPKDISGYQKVALVLNGGMSENWNDITKVPNAIPAIIIYELFTHGSLVLVVLLILFTYCSLRICSRSKNFVHQWLRSIVIKDLKKVNTQDKQVQSVELLAKEGQV